MKKMKRFASAALAALLLAGSAPSALALDTTPPMYKQFGYDSAEAFMQSNDWEWYMLDYDEVSDIYRTALQELKADPKRALECGNFDSWEHLDLAIEYGIWDSRDDYLHDVACSFVHEKDDDMRKQLTVQLNGKNIRFTDTKPEKVNGRIMVPFRAIAEAFGAEVSYDSGAITAKKDGQTLSFALGSKQLTIVDDKTGKTLKTTEIDTAPYKKSSRTYVPVRFFAEAFGLNVLWDDYYHTAVLYDRAALIAEVNSKFTVLNQWLKAQPKQDTATALKSVATVNALYTVFDTVDGNKDYNANANVTILSQGQNLQLTATADLRMLADLLLDTDTDNLLSATALTMLKASLKDIRVDFLCDPSSGSLYLRCPSLAKLLVASGYDNEENVTAMANGAWLHIHSFELLEPIVGTTNQLDELRDFSLTSAGDAIVTSMEQEDENRNFEFLWESVQAHANYLAAIFGDELFTRSGTRYTAKSETDDGYGTTQNTTFTLDIANGSFSAAFEKREEYWKSVTLTTFEFSGNLQDCRIKLSQHKKNDSIVTVDLTLSSSPSDSAPNVKLPDGSKVVEWVYNDPYEEPEE
ncbi:hypothetical protein K350107B32_24770 [Agathobaculum butyriciproducens]